MVWLRIERRSRGAFRTTLENSGGEGRPLHHPVAGRTYSAQMAALVREVSRLTVGRNPLLWKRRRQCEVYSRRR